MARTKQLAVSTKQLALLAKENPIVARHQKSQREREKEFAALVAALAEQRRQQEQKDQPAPVSLERQTQLAAIVKERELIAKVLLIRKEYEETVLPNLPSSIKFTGGLFLGSLAPLMTVELRKGQLDEAEKQLLNQ